MMKNILSSTAVMALAISTTNHTSELTMRRTGTERLTQNIQTTIAKKKAGLIAGLIGSAQTGAKYGALVGTLAATNAAIVELARGHNDQLATFILATGAGTASAGAVISMVNHMWNENSSAAWLAQLEKLATKDKDGEFKYISDKLMTIGVPIKPGVNNELLKAYGTVYLLAKGFDNAIEAYKDSGIEIYIMPKDENLGDVFAYIQEWLHTSNGAGKIENKEPLVLFLAIEPTPGVSKSLWSAKNLPRIILGLNPNATVEDARRPVRHLMRVLGQKYDGIGYRPRYSEEIVGSHKLIYAGKGSGDYKESAEGQEEYRSMKSKSWWRLLSSDVEDMAYPSEKWRIGAVE